MTDLEVFKKFMGWMEMEVNFEWIIENNIVIDYKDKERFWEEWELMSKQWYDSFFAWWVFTQDWKMIKSYIDSHVAYSSKNSNYISSLISRDL